MVLAHVDGQPNIYLFTNGLNSVPTVIAGAPTQIASLEIANNIIFVAGDGQGSDTQLKVYNGGWSSPTTADAVAVVAWCVKAKPGTPATVLALTTGGGMFASSNAGVTWTHHIYDLGATYSAPEVPYVETAGQAFLAVSDFCWHPTLNRIYISYGKGIVEFDNPPRTTQAQKFIDRSKGIKQMLHMGSALVPATLTSPKKVLIWSQDRPLFVVDQAKAGAQVAGYGPDYTVNIRHSNGMDSAINNPLCLAGTFRNDSAKALALSNDSGKTWTPSPTWPNLGAGQFVSGNIAYGNVGNMVWLSCDNKGLAFTKDGGNTWAEGIFKDGSGNTVGKSSGKPFNWYFIRRNVLFADKATPGRFLLYWWGTDTGGAGAEDTATQGVWESVDGGETWLRVRTTRFPGNTFFNAQFKGVPGNPNHVVFATGPLYDGVGILAPDGLYFSTAKGASAVTMPGFKMAEDVTFGKPLKGKTYPRLWVSGHRQVAGVWTYGVWQCDDFNPANPTAATWTRRHGFPNGRPGPYLLLGDMDTYDWLLMIPYSGGSYLQTYRSRLRLQ